MHSLKTKSFNAHQSNKTDATQDSCPGRLVQRCFNAHQSNKTDATVFIEHDPLYLGVSMLTSPARPMLHGGLAAPVTTTLSFNAHQSSKTDATPTSNATNCMMKMFQCSLV